MDHHKKSPKPNNHLPLPDEEKHPVTYAASLASSHLALTPSPTPPTPEVPSPIIAACLARGLDVSPSGQVTWSSHPYTHPRNWRLSRKLYSTALICFLEFIMTLISNTGSALCPFAAEDLGVSRETALVCFTTTYLLAQALGGLVFPPIAEAFGGRTIYIASTALYAVGNAALAAWPSTGMVVAMRLLTGALSAMPCVVATGTLEDLWGIESRVFVVHAWICAAVVGLAAGPAVGTFVSASAGLGWTWVFHIAAIVTGISALLCIPMRESRPSRVLRDQVALVSRETNFSGLSVDAANSLPTLQQFTRTSLLLPLRLFFTEPIVWLTSTMAATVYGIVYLFSESLTLVYRTGYAFTAQQASLVILAIGAGVLLSFLPRIYDIRILRSRRSEGVALQPEDKLFGFYVAAPMLAAGLWMFSWTVPPLVQGIPPSVSLAALVLVGFAVVEFDNVLCGYLTDAYASHAASANAPMGFLRAALSGVFPLFGHLMFDGLGANYALFLLAGVATAYCGVAFVFGRYGRRIRERSPFAEKAWEASLENVNLKGGMVSVESSVLSLPALTRL